MVVAFLMLSLTAFSQDYLFDSWEVKDGLPQNTVARILQTSDGYLWVGTEGGLSRFDGVRFTNFDVQNTPALHSNRIAWLHENSNGDLLIATTENLVLLRNGIFTDLKTKYNYEINHVVSIMEMNEGDLVIRGHHGSAIHVDSETYAPLSNLRKEGETLLENDSIWLDPYDLVSKTFPSGFLSFGGVQNLVLSNEAIVTHDEAPEIWLVTESTLLHFFGEQSHVAYDLSKYFQWNDELRLCQKDSSLFVFNRNGSSLAVLNLRTKEITHRHLPSPCPDGSINRIYSDRENNLWMATSTCGLVKLKPDRFSYVDTDSLDLRRNMYPVFRDSRNRILLGTFDKGILAFDQQGRKIEVPSDPIISQRFISSITEYNNEIYFNSVINDCIFRWNNDSLERIPFPQGKFSQANALFVTKDNRLLVGAHEGLYQMVNDSLEFHPLSKEKFISLTTTLFEDDDDKLWVLTYLNAYCYDQKRNTTLIDFKERWPHIQEYRGIHQDDEGRMYFGTYGFGLCILINDSLHQITASNGLKENVVSTITEDSKGNIWLTGNKGLSRIRKSELMAILNGEKDKLTANIFNEQSDALRSGEFNGGIQQAKFHLGDERYIFPTFKGAVMVDFATMPQNKLAPPVHIEALQYSDTLVKAYQPVSLDYSGERAEFRFTALSFVAPEKVRFQYRLEGYDKDWVESGSERKASYSKLPPGDYTFRVIASNDEDVWNMDGASYSFSILPPYYMTWWFRALLIVGSLLLTVGIVRWYILRDQKIQRDKSAMLDILPDLVVKLNRDGKYLDIYGNPSNLIAPAPRLQNRYIQEFLPESLAAKTLEALTAAIETEEIQHFDYGMASAKGEVKHYEGRFIGIDKNEVLCIIRDTTANRTAEAKIRTGETKLRKALEKEKRLLKKLNEQQKNQLESIIDTEEKERKRIAADLHDGLGQLLSSVKINLGVARDKIQEVKLKETETLINKSNNAIDLITAEVRNISYNLLPPSLEQFGLASAIEEEVLKLSIDPNRRIFFDYSLTDVKFDQRLEVVLFRVFQELTNNAIKHANATEIMLQLIQHDRELVFMIEDNGIGFDYGKSLQKKNHSGLKNIKSRIELIKGKLAIDSRPETGTSITIKIPL